MPKKLDTSFKNVTGHIRTVFNIIGKINTLILALRLLSPALSFFKLLIVFQYIVARID